VPWEVVRPGVYRVRRGTDVICVVVAGQLPRAEHNALLQLFSASAEQVGSGAGHYRPHARETSTLVYQLFEGYQQKWVAMIYTIEDFKRECVKEFLKNLTPEERLKGLSAEERLKGLSPDELLQALPLEAIERFLEQRKAQRRSRQRRPGRKR
jgi:hypothetical protein